MELRNAYTAMIKAYNGGWDAMAAALGFTRSALENRIYERKGQAVLVETALQMQAISNTTSFAESVAVVSGGTFVKLPDLDHVDKQSLLAKFNELHAELGMLSQKFNEYTEDDEIDDGERVSLNSIGDDIHKNVQELLALSYKVYCKDRGKPAARAAAAS